jgi:hypothetical protein
LRTRCGQTWERRPNAVASEPSIIVPYKDHPIFVMPSDDSVIWRYIDFTKLVGLLHSASLYFSRADLLGDRFEGSFSQANIDQRPTVYASWGDAYAKAFEQVRAFTAGLVRCTYLSCWHVNPIESAAMWGLYTDPSRGIAIQSTVGRLIRSLSAAETREINVGMVAYIDYKRDWLPEGNSLYPFIHKRRSYEFERELRAVIQDIPMIDGKLAPLSPTPEGLEVKVATELLVERIVVSPSAPRWFTVLVESVTQRYGPQLTVVQSDLAGDPVY